jgi:hypothetical protein
MPRLTCWPEMTPRAAHAAPAISASELAWPADGALIASGASEVSEAAALTRTFRHALARSPRRRMPISIPATRW